MINQDQQSCSKPRTPRSTPGHSLGALAMAAVMVSGASAFAQVADVMIPAAPGGGWDRTGRATMQAMQQEGLVVGVQYTNKGGGGGTVGLTDFVRNSKGKDNALMFMGVIMIGSAADEQISELRVEMTTPIAQFNSRIPWHCSPCQLAAQNRGGFHERAEKGSWSPGRRDFWYGHS